MCQVNWGENMSTEKTNNLIFTWHFGYELIPFNFMAKIILYFILNQKNNLYSIDFFHVRSFFVHQNDFSSSKSFFQHQIEFFAFNWFFYIESIFPLRKRKVIFTRQMYICKTNSREHVKLIIQCSRNKIAWLEEK